MSAKTAVREVFSYEEPTVFDIQSDTKPEPTNSHYPSLKNHFKRVDTGIKGKNSFTNDELDFNISQHNPNTEPLYYNFEPFKMKYVNTLLVPISDIDKHYAESDFTVGKANNGYSQPYRKGRNPNEPTLMQAVRHKGFNLREKFVYLARDKENKMTVFAGNSVLTSARKYNFDNVIARIFEFDGLFSKDFRLIVSAGVYQNNTEKTAHSQGNTDDEDIIHALFTIDENNGFGILPDNPSDKQINQMVDRIEDTITSMKFTVLKDYKSRIKMNEAFSRCINSIVGKKQPVGDCYDVKEGIEVIEELNRLWKNRYRDSQMSRYICVSSNTKVKFVSTVRVDRQNVLSGKNVTPFSYDKGILSVIYHTGSTSSKTFEKIPDFLRKAKAAIDDTNDYLNFILEYAMVPRDGGLLSQGKTASDVATLNPKLFLAGVLNQIRALETLYPEGNDLGVYCKYKDVIPMDDFLKIYDDFKSKNPNIKL